MAGNFACQSSIEIPPFGIGYAVGGLGTAVWFPEAGLASPAFFAAGLTSGAGSAAIFLVPCVFLFGVFGVFGAGGVGVGVAAVVTPAVAELPGTCAAPRGEPGGAIA